MTKIDTDYVRKTYTHMQRRADYLLRHMADEIDCLRRKDQISRDILRQLVQMQNQGQYRKKAA